MDLSLPLTNGGVLVGSLDCSERFRREKKGSTPPVGGVESLQSHSIDVSNAGSEGESRRASEGGPDLHSR